MPDVERLGGDLVNWATGTSENKRTPTVFVSTAFGASASATIWTPTAGKRFRIQGFSLTVGTNVASATNDNPIQFRDGTTVIFRYSAYFPTTSITTTPGQYTLANLQFNATNGYLSTAANNTFNILLPAATTAGLFSCFAYGTEE